MRNYRIFISHSWKYDEHERILRFLDETEDFYYSDYSIPQGKAISRLSDNELSDKIRSHIKPSQIILIPAGMEINYSRYIKFELEVAIRNAETNYRSNTLQKKKKASNFDKFRY